MDGAGFGGGFLSVSRGGSLDLEQPPPMTLSQMNLMIGLDDDRHRPIHLVEVRNPAPRSVAGGKGDDGDEASSEDGNSGNTDKGKRGLSPWHRMKWTDDVVRLLIAAVAYVGDDSILNDAEGLKRKFGVFQKKGKWKTVSKIMIGRGSRVSPQQCEDKFNDLNKRYKKLNDILGRGTSCRVVENPALLDSMPQISAKAKDVARKLLTSKHLFYKEMRAYHDGQRIPNCPDLDLHLEGGGGDGDDDDEVTNDEDEDSSDDSENDSDDDDDAEKDDRNDGNDCGHNGQRGFGLEIGTRQSLDRKAWIRKQLLGLEEESVNIEARTLELEKQRFKWLRYRSKKTRELERLRLENERKRLANERSFLEIKQKELEINNRVGSK